MSGTQTVRRSRVAERVADASLHEASTTRRPVVPVVLTGACIVLVLVLLATR